MSKKFGISIILLVFLDVLQTGLDIGTIHELAGWFIAIVGCLLYIFYDE